MWYKAVCYMCDKNATDWIQIDVSPRNRRFFKGDHTIFYGCYEHIEHLMEKEFVPPLKSYSKECIRRCALK